MLCLPAHFAVENEKLGAPRSQSVALLGTPAGRRVVGANEHAADVEN